MLADRSVQIYKKWLFFTVFSSLGPFPQDFGQVKGWLMLKLRKIKYVSHAVVCPIVFILLYDQYWQGRVLKIMKNNRFFSIFCCFGRFPQVLWAG